MVERKILEEKLSELANISSQLWNIAVYFLKSGDVEDGEALFLRAEAVTTAILELRQDLWDIDPDLVDENFLPEETVDLRPAVARLELAEPLLRESVLADILSYAPDDVVSKAAAAGSETERLASVAGWVMAQSGPIPALHRLSRELDAPRRWRRVCAARALARLGFPDLVDPQTGDVDSAAVYVWRSRNAIRNDG